MKGRSVIFSSPQTGRSVGIYPPLMRKHLALTSIICLFFAVRSFSQGKIRGSVKGTIADTASKQMLSDATVSVTPESDSSDAEFTITDKHGSFIIRNLNPGNYRLLITFEGLRHISKKFSVHAAEKDVDLGTLYMQKVSDLLQEVVIQRPPMSIKKDTVEYTADLFATKPNAFVEDQLKKLPGVEVDASGNITAQGEKVTRVLVNGKRFFSDDPKLATRNIPPDIVDKYQIFDDLDDQSKFSGFDNGNRVKTLNIITRKDKRQGYFGRAIAGAGTNQDYDESINFHRFNNDQQISLLGEGNDINKQNFTIQDILGSSGSRRGSGGGPAAATNQSSPGITTVWAGGANYHDNWGPKTEGYGSYFYNFTHVVSDQQNLTQEFFDARNDTSNTTSQTRSAIARTTNQRVYFNLDHKIDSNNSFIFRPNISFQTTSPNASSVSSTVDQHDSAVTSSTGNTSSTNSGFNINGSNFTFRHKFHKPTRTFSLDLNGTANVNDGDGFNYAVNNYYKLDSFQTLNQHYTDSLHSYTISPTMSYTEPISKRSIIELNYNYTYNKSNTINNTYDYDNASHGYSSFDSLFSNSYKFVSYSNRFTLSYRIQHPKYNINIGSGVQATHFNSLNTTKGIDVQHGYLNLTPTVNFSYSFSNNQRLRFYYTGRTGSPTASQLQPLITTNDDINFTIGNPDLKPQFTHSVRFLYSSFNPSTQNVLFATLNASTTVNDIQSSIIPNKKGGDTTTSVNLNGTYNVAGYFDYGFALKHPKSNLNFITNINYSQSQNLVYSLESPIGFQHDYTRTTSFTEKVSWTTNIKKNFDMNFGSSSTYTINRNSLNTKSDLNAFSQVFNAEITAYTNSGWLIATTFTYTISDNRTPGYNASVPLLSPSIARQLFKKKNGEIRLNVFDLLKQNTSVSKSVSLNQVSNTRTTTLSQYAMLTFTYNLNNFAGSRQRRMPGVFPGRFRGGNGEGGGGGGGGGKRGGGPGL
jgi:Outer membrane protein beta-barrel family/Carboxypeptidase regulatory-like domain